MLIDTVDPEKIVLQVYVQNLDGTPKTVLTSATVRVYKIEAGSEVVLLAATPLVQVGSTNVWRYTWTPVSLPVGHYFAEYSLVDLADDHFVDVEDIDIRDIAVQADLVLIRKIERGRWRIVDEEMIIYDEDALTPLLRFALKDIDGIPSNVNIFERIPV